MSSKTVRLWRHGRTAYNASGRLQGQIDIELDEVGRWQAATAGAVLARRGRVHRIVSSDLVRAHATARSLAQIVDVEVVLDERLRERSFGEWEGLTAEEISTRWPQQWQEWITWRGVDVEGGETREQVAERMVPAVREHAAALPDGGTLVIVSHGAAITITAAVLMGQESTWRGVAGISNAHWNEFAVPHDHDGVSGAQLTPWRLLGHNLGPMEASSNWDAGPDKDVPDLDDSAREPS